MGSGAGGVPLGGVVPALPGLLTGAGASAIPIGVGALTVTVACPLTPPCSAVMCALPALFPATFPLASTVAVLAASLVRFTALVRSAVVLSAYVPVAVYGCTCPTFNVPLAGATARLTSDAGVTTIPVCV